MKLSILGSALLILTIAVIALANITYRQTARIALMSSTIEAQRQAYHAVEAALQSRHSEYQRIQEQSDLLRDHIGDLYETNQAARDWADGVIDPSILERLRELHDEGVSGTAVYPNTDGASPSAPR